MSALTGRWRLDLPGQDCERMFAIAVDIESYPRFLPFCRAARIRRREGNALDVDNQFGAGPIQARFPTRAEFERPHRLEITSRAAPFRLFRLTWLFTPLPGGCRVEARYHIELRSPLLHGLARLAMPEVEPTVLAAFRRRVAELYGPER
ncbi:type II toxin-antitoxin system RatA family toxin [Phaeospirillum tilakii]|uniref:Type II toxin-antitoxin system RatA family toxin n=1 Tax=Phaeospirillum tilakii TaxID=741673 RepID=A0ABW5CIE5_9PROT